MRRKPRVFLFGIALVPYILIAATGGQAKPTYGKDVLPVMKAHCASCHAGPSAAAGLDLTTVAGIRKVVEAKNSAKSPLILRMRGIGGAQMPMGFAPLAKETIDSIAAWIDDGATVEAESGKHWAYIRPTMPAVPKIKGKTWPKNPIDNFVLARLEKEGMAPSPDAAKETLIRRVYLDLIGLPPSPQEVDRFLADKRPDAYEQVVDVLLKNSHFGEKQAEPWLDLSRYADSDGYEKDLNRTAWKYRDWLIDAFNTNMPYDEFTIEQLAGDLLPYPRVDQLVATGFNRNTMFNREGGVDQEEAHFNVIVDRVGTTATVWLGSTLQCARCHDHKYDPFTQRDFYKMAAFYSNSVILPEGSKSVGEEKWFESEIRVPSPEQTNEQRALKIKIAADDRQIATWNAGADKAFSDWKKAAGQGIVWTTVTPDAMKAAHGSALAASQDGIVTATGPVPTTDDYTIESKASGPIAGLRIEAIADPSLPAGGPGRAGNGNFVISKVKLTIGGKPANFIRAVADFDQRNNGADRLLSYDPNVGWAVDGAEGKSHEVIIELKEPLQVPSGTPIQIEIDQHWPGGRHTLGKFRVSLTATAHPAFLYLKPQLRPLLGKDDLTETEQKSLRDLFLATTPELDSARTEVAKNRSRLARVESQIPTALVMKDKPTPGPLTAYIHGRGEFLSPTELVTSGFPSVLAPDPAPGTEHLQVRKNLKIVADDPKTTPAPVPHINDNSHPPAGPVLTRLDLAKWLVSKENPMTARVQVNRLWEEFFGRGIVETSEDFGTQGSRPSHPELLDWLACKFMDKKWDMKGMIRLIVTSHTYRQSSSASAALMRRDPQNILLSRGPRFRLDAETIRDNYLSVSGLLDRKIGGPSVFPYQPANVWDNPYNGEQWMMSKGGDRYRRGLYTFLKRTSPYPTFMSLDSTSRESCTVRRIRTNTPLQALEMLNDQAVLDAAKALGQRMVKEGGKSPIAYGFRICTGRKPTPQELTRLIQLQSTLIARYKATPETAKKLGSSPDQAAWSMVANVLLNLDETVTKN